VHTTQIMNFTQRIIVPAVMAVLLSAMTGTSAPAQEYTAEDVLARVATTYGRIGTAQGTISRTTIRQGMGAVTLSGTFMLMEPNLLRFEYTGSETQTALFDGSGFYIYFPATDSGMFWNAEMMSPIERYSMSPAGLLGNAARLFSIGFTTEILTQEDGTVVIKAVPTDTRYYNYVLAGIDTATWMVRGIEHFDRADNLISQVRYPSFITTEDGTLFPEAISTLSVIATGILKETTTISNVSLNVSTDRDTFPFPGGTDTSWTDQTIPTDR
jgi:outer membrane lipoprotein-sorting protein